MKTIKSDVSTTNQNALPHHRDGRGYYGASVEVAQATESDGVENGSVLGCNANNWNPNASCRTANCNNHAGNGNDNYVGSWSVTKEINQICHTSRLAKAKITEGSAATGGQGQCDYDSLPFWGENKAESNACLSVRDKLEKIRQTNKKRKLKNLKPFLTDIDVIREAFERTMSRTNANKRTKDFWRNMKDEVCKRIQKELMEQTYCPMPTKVRMIPPRGKGGKWRKADISEMYDRIVTNVLYIVIEQKFMNKLTRNVYSGVKNRSLLSNDRRYCMINQIRHWVIGHPDKWVGQTDIRHFYENLRTKVVIGIMFKTIVCPFTRWLLLTLFSHLKRVPIGGSLSQLMAMIAVNDCDREILRRFNVRLFCFGDNRLICGDKQEARRAMSFQMSYYEGALLLSVKGDYHTNKVSDGFSFCKYRYYKSFVSVRAEIRRRAIRAYRKGRKHYEGYRGMFMKTDSSHLRKQIEHNYMELTNKHGMRINTQRGERKKFRDLPDGAQIHIVDFEIVVSKHQREKHEEEKKEGDIVATSIEPRTKYYVNLTYIHVNGDRKYLYHSTEGSEEIVEAVRLLETDRSNLHQALHVGHDGTSSYFEEFHTTKEEACELICEKLGI